MDNNHLSLEELNGFIDKLSEEFLNTFRKDIIDEIEKELLNRLKEEI